ncbi:MAG: helix-turn-helix transcriptional regulator [Clostridia bacterium]|nr:helix-turn-helix transcriptional regulator [Clostridia bacterium]
MKNVFSENLRRLRIEKKLKQEELAKSLCTTQRKVSYWESGKIEPDINSLWAIADFFEISIDELVGRES